MRNAMLAGVHVVVLSAALAGCPRAEKTVSAKGFKADVLMLIEFLEKRAVGLLEAVAQEKLS